MKNKFSQSHNSTPKLPVFLFLIASTLAGSGSALYPSAANASAELDRQFAMETVGALRAWDNLDGLFGDYVALGIKEFFALEPRFKLVDISPSEPVLLNSKIPYLQLVEDPEVLNQLVKTLRVQTLLRTRVTKAGNEYRFRIEWLQMPHAIKIAEESFEMRGPERGVSFTANEVRKSVREGLMRLTAKLPFQGHVTGRDADSLTINLGTQAGAQPGDTLVLETLEDVKKHPIEKAIVDWRFRDVGRAEVVSVDGGVVFAKIVSEESTRKVMRYQKITRVIPKPPTVEGQGEKNIEATAATESARFSPSFGYVSGGLWLGPFNRDYSTGGAASKSYSGGGFLTGLKVDGQLWLTKNWFGELGLGYGFASFTQKDNATGADTAAKDVSFSATQFKLAGGYNFYFSEMLFGPKVFTRMGYRNTSHTLPVTPTENTAPFSLNSVFVGIGGDLPIRDDIGVQFSLDIGVLRGATVTNPADSSLKIDTASTSDVAFFLGGYYRFEDHLSVRLGLDFLSQTAEFTTGGNITHRVIGFGPSLIYYF